MKTILVTGAAGYIGSHCSLELLNSGYEVVGVDNLNTGSLCAIERVEALAKRPLLGMHVLDLRDRTALNGVFRRYKPHAVIHTAGLKSVAESVQDPSLYYEWNVGSTLALIDSMKAANVHDMVFSSSCTVYGNPSADSVPLHEDSTRAAINPYGQSKLMIEQMLEDLCASSNSWRVRSLRYFNPIGAHASGRLGDAPSGIPNNLVPYAMQVGIGKLDNLPVFGNDYPTKDGTCIRDYVHIVDVARGHVKAVEAGSPPGFTAVNLGTGEGYSVLDVIKACSKAIGSPIPVEMQPRRSGDATAVFSDSTKAFELFGWAPELDLQQMCDDHWRWQSRNPNGYLSSVQKPQNEFEDRTCCRDAVFVDHLGG